VLSEAWEPSFQRRERVESRFMRDVSAGTAATLDVLC